MGKDFASGRGRLLGHGIIYPVPIPLDPAAYAGALVVGLDPADNRRKLYFSDGVEWTRSIFDTTISEQIERFIDDLFLNGFDEADLPDPTLLENLRRYAFNNTRGLPGFVWNDQWNYLTDEARAAEIAADVAANVFRIQEADIFLTVNRNAPEVEGVSYQTLNAAIEFACRFQPAYRRDWAAGGAFPLIQPTVQINIAAAHGVMQEQIALQNNSAGHVFITADNPVVEVDCAYLTRAIDLFSGFHSFISADLGSAAPTTRSVVFRAINTGSVPSDPAAEAVWGGAYPPTPVGLLIMAGSTTYVEGGLNVLPGGTMGDVFRPAGYTHFAFNLVVYFGSAVGVYNSTFDDASAWGILNEGSLFIFKITAKNCADFGLRCMGGTSATFILGGGGEDGAYPGGFANDFRRVAGSDTGADITVALGARISAHGARGGRNIAINTLTGSGIIFG